MLDIAGDKLTASTFSSTPTNRGGSAAACMANQQSAHATTIGDVLILSDQHLAF
jgi:hypothetical protein